MPHTIEPAASGRSKCRGCGQLIAKGELRFGERLPNPFADGDMTVWLHLTCAAFKRPESLAEVIEDAPPEQQQALSPVISHTTEHHRLQRINGIERSPSARARCRHCREPIAKDDWRIPLAFFEEGMFNASGNVHLTCSMAYFETTDIVDALCQFGDLNDAELAEVTQQLASGAAP